ncbi:MAG: glycoside hydrolase family 3 C-terminal domain-containing protein [Chloroflexota bacterium]|nr:glycoside hydrolase family 3 C-terminal domain-containing protein [Chloroflexota bacterium]
MTRRLIPDEIQARVRELVGQLTLEEKAALTVGRDFWTTQPVERLGIPSAWLADGPTGLRKSQSSQTPGIGDSLPATCFPTASALASSWDVDLAREVGSAIGIEAQVQGVQIVLGPGVNLKRSPLAGRNFEYMSEDPVLSGEMAAAFIEGVQGQGVGTSLKHFTANEQETGRMYVDSIVDERTLREVYLRAFEIAVRKAQPWTLMCAYNRLNGEFCAEHRTLLTSILRDEWGHEGFVMSDWMAVNDRPGGIDAGLDLQMPGGPSVPGVIAAVRAGELEEARLDSAVEDVLGIVLLAEASIQAIAILDKDAHHRLARRAAAESIVLLKNETNLLPLRRDEMDTIAVIGGFARKPRFQGAGSSEVVPTRVDTLLDQLEKVAGTAALTYAQGYGLEGVADAPLLAEARDFASGADVAIVVVGLPASMETEGRDRSHIDLPKSHNDLVRAVLEVQPNTVVVLINGSAVALPWVNDAPAVVEAWLGGQAGGGAIVDVLTGAVNPSGKLSETFPVRLEDTPAFLNFPTAGDGTVRFSEGVFTGHRWYDARQIASLFPFGHGLSYTTFAYDGLTVDAAALGEDGNVEITVMVENTGERFGQEVVQVYAGECMPRVPRPKRELKAFAKVALQPGEDKTVQFSLGWRDFAYYDVVAGAWVMDPGDYEISIGASSADIRLGARVTLESTHQASVAIDRGTPFSKALRHPVARELLRPILDGMAQQFGGSEASEMMMLFLADTPLRKLVIMGALTDVQLDDLIAASNVNP